MWAGGGMVGGMEGLERCPRERPGPEPAIARRARVPTGEMGVESRLAGVAEEPCPAGAEAVRRVAAEEVLVVDPVCDMVVRLGAGSWVYNGRERFARERRVPYKGAGGAISVMLWHSVMFENTFKHLHCGRRFFFVCGLIRMGSGVWVRSWIVQALNRSDGKLFFSPTSRRCERRRYRSVR